MRLQFKIPVALFLLFTTLMVSGQGSNDKKKIMDLFLKSQKVYENNTVFKLDLNYKLFTTYKSNAVSETYDGVLFKNGEEYYSKIASTEFIKIGSISLKIDNASKLIELSSENSKIQLNDLYDLNSMVSNFDVFELTSNADFWICSLTAPRITFVPYGKVVIHIHKTKHTISKQVLYLLTQNKYKNKDGKIVMDYPRLEINFSNFTTAPIDFKSRFDKETYLVQRNKKYYPAGSYKNYKIVD